MNDLSKIWQSALVEIESTVSKANFSTWFKDTRISKEDSGVIYLAVPNSFTQEWLSKKFHNAILRILRQMNDNIRALEYVIESKNDAKKDSGERRQMMSNINMQIPLQDFYINKDDNLNPRYTFTNFVVGPFNELAFTAAQAIVKNPGNVYNPFFVYGGTGRGKTHLIQAIGHEIKRLFPNKKIYYLTSERFGSDFINSLQENKVQQFKEKYRKYDVVIMDDIQFFSNKEKFQEELFHFFNTFHDTGRQLVFSSDMHPNIIPGLEDRLRGRFNVGLTIDIPEPDHESRMAIVKTKCSVHNISLNDEIIEHLALSIKDNIRELEGVINIIACQADLHKRQISINDLKNILRNNSKPKKNVSIKDIVKVVCDFYGLNEDYIYNKTRKKEVVKPRQVIMFLLREDFGISFPAIGEKLGGRDHTTAIHSYEKVREEIKSNTVLSQEINQIRTML
jgi:chromosomal replication initiator protein